jgi:hypothetical protein
VLAAVLAMIVSVFVVFKLLGQGRPHVEPNIIKAERRTSPSLTISPTGPHPKAVVVAEFEFGHMEVGEERSHVFTIHNEGAAPLNIENAGTTCQCTVSDMKQGETREVLPGKSVDVTLTWKPTVQAEKFSKGADFHTNDPAHKTIALRILGMVAPRVTVYPEKDWFIANVTDEKPGEFTGAILSPVVDQFQVLAVECRSPLLSAEVVPLDEQRLATHHGLCGYEIKVTLKPEMPLGPFRFPMTIKTDLPERNSDGSLGKPAEFEVLVQGMHRGVIQPNGREWIDEKMAISLGSFEASAGKKVTLTVFVKGPPEEGLRLTAPVVCNPEQLQCDLQRDERAAGSHQRYLLTVEYPAGSPRGVYREADPARIRIQTNHPHAREVEFLVLFSAY